MPFITYTVWSAYGQSSCICTRAIVTGQNCPFFSKYILQLFKIHIFFLYKNLFVKYSQQRRIFTSDIFDIFNVRNSIFHFSHIIKLFFQIFIHVMIKMKISQLSVGKQQLPATGTLCMKQNSNVKVGSSAHELRGSCEQLLLYWSLEDEGEWQGGEGLPDAIYPISPV